MTRRGKSNTPLTSNFWGNFSTLKWKGFSYPIILT
nr:MAG TPA: hypothetical protein [Caudoviricetes sp.]